MTITLELNVWIYILTALCLYGMALSAAAALGWKSDKYWFLRTTPGTPYITVAYIFMILREARNAAGEEPFLLWAMLIMIAFGSAGLAIDYRANRGRLRDQSAQLVADLERMYGKKDGSGTGQ